MTFADRNAPNDLSAGETFVLRDGVHATVLTTAAETDGRHDFVDATLAAGAGTPLHLHTRYEERLWVVSGSITVWAGDDNLVLRSGDFHLVPMNTPHALRAGDDGCRALNVSSPAGFAELVARAGIPLSELTPTSEPDLDLFMAVTTELGDVVLGPPGTLPADLPG